MPTGLFDTSLIEPLVQQGYTLLTPNQRLARRIKSEWDAVKVASGSQVWPRLQVYSLDSWLLLQWQAAVRNERLPGALQLQTGQALEIWRQIILDQMQADQEFHLLRPKAAAEQAHQARELLIKWQLDMRDPSIRQQFQLDRDCAAFLGWLDAFEARLERDNALTQADCMRQIASLQDVAGPNLLALVECDDIAPVAQTALQALGNDVRPVQVGEKSANLLIHPSMDRRAELQAVARWAARLRKEDSGVTIGIVLADMSGDRTSLEYVLRREFDCLGSNYNALPVNFSTGIRLSYAPMVRDALMVLTVLQGQANVVDVVSLLRSRFLDMPDAESPLAQKFVRRLYERGSASIELAELRYLANELSAGEQSGLALGRHLLASYRLKRPDHRAEPSLWAAHFNEVLALWGWPGTRSLDSLEFQQLELWHATLDKLHSYDALCPSLNSGDALRLLSDICEQQVSQPRTDDAAIQVLGPLEAVGLSFDHLWLCGMQASNWPAPPRPNPFIPLVLQSVRGFPHATAEREWQFGVGRINQYRRTTATLHASFSRLSDGVPDIASPLLRDFTLAELPLEERTSVLWRTRLQAAQLESLTDDSAPPIDIAKTQAGGSGLLEDQSQCPFRAFARRRLLVQPLPEAVVGLSPAERGTLLHDALFRLWGDIGDQQGLQALEADEEHTLISRVVQGVTADAARRTVGRIGEGYWELETDRLEQLLQEWLAVERQRSGFVVLLREQELNLTVGPLAIRLRIDRIDELPDGSRVIIDYKSGRSSVSDWMGERPARPQLLLYSLVAPQETAALAFATLKPGQCGFVGLGKTEAAPGITTDLRPALKAGMTVEDWDELNVHWRLNLEALAQAFVDGEAAVDPLAPSSCVWCGLQPLCRIDRTQERGTHK